METMKFRSMSALVLLLLGTLGAGFADAQEVGVGRETWPILVIHVQADGAEVAVVDARIYESTVPLKGAVKTAGRARLKYNVTDASGVPLTEGAEEDARVLRAPLSEPGVPFEGHQTVTRPMADYFIRVPYTPEMRYLQLSLDSSAAEAPQKPARVQVVDLLQVLQR